MNRTCPECAREFDLATPTEAAEWFEGHDCEAPPKAKDERLVAFLPQRGGIELRHSRCKLADLQAFVGGYIEALHGDGWVMWLDEDGKTKEGYGVNVLATALTRDLGLMPGDLIVGDVVVTGALDHEGELTNDVPQALIDRATALLLVP